jgi:transcriptional regulator with XRE-family HTH domain
MDSLGSRLRKAREDKRLSQVDVFKKTGINNKTLSRYENNGTEPDADSLKRLSEVYEVTTDWIIGGGNQKESALALPKSELDRIISATESHFNVNLHDDPVVLNAMKQLAESLAKMKQGK